MTHYLLVVIGCDSPEVLSDISLRLKRLYPLSLNIVSVDRQADLITVSKSVKPDLVIISFKDALTVIRNFSFYVDNAEIPLFCLIEKSEDETLYWSEKNILFTFPLQHLGNKVYFNSRIKSIFELKKTKSVSPPIIYTSQTVTTDQNENINLSRYVLELDQKKSVLTKIKNRIEHLYNNVDESVRNELTSIVNSIKISSGNDRIWEDFKIYFEKIDPDFLNCLSHKHPELTSKDLKYCCYLKMNMSNEDIRSLLGINQESVRTHKYRLKKKLSLRKEHDLRQYVNSIGNRSLVKLTS